MKVTFARPKVSKAARSLLRSYSPSDSSRMLQRFVKTFPALQVVVCGGTAVTMLGIRGFHSAHVAEFLHTTIIRYRSRSVPSSFSCPIVRASVLLISIFFFMSWHDFSNVVFVLLILGVPATYFALKEFEAVAGVSTEGGRLEDVIFLFALMHSRIKVQCSRTLHDKQYFRWNQVTSRVTVIF